MKQNFIYPFLFIIIISSNIFGKDYKISSPDKSIDIVISIDQQVKWSISKDGKTLLDPSEIKMEIDGKSFYTNLNVKKVKKKENNNILKPVIKVKSALISDIYNEIRIDFKNDYSLLFRVYDDGAAYRFRTGFNKKVKVMSETIEFNFSDNHKIYFPEEDSFYSHQERYYHHINLSDIGEKRKSSIPALIDIKDGTKILISEADLEDYPGFYLTGKKALKTQLNGIFPHYPLEVKKTSDRDVPVTKYSNYLAITNGKRKFPWRVLIIADNDKELFESQMIYKLSTPLKLKDTDWINPGKVAWDWWNALNITGVDFESGVNTETYKYYIDFASKYGIEYIILDEGWYKLGDLFAVKKDINIQEIVNYGKSKNVGIILWVVWKTLDDQLDEIMKQFDKWGIKGIKVDFMQRDDQKMVKYYHKIAKVAAEHHLLVDFHGSYKPTGLRRAYPNVMTREGVLGLEQSKWSEKASPDMAVTIPFIRMVSGPVDYTPGAMRNAIKENFQPVWSKPMSQGTRCHQLAMYIVYESPLQMLADNPSHYYKEPECMNFLSKVPVVWDETHALKCKVGEYILVARRNGNDWYIGGMTNWTARSFEIPLDFLGEGKYYAEIYQDGLNASKNAEDYKFLERKVDKNTKLNIKMKSGGGYAIRIFPVSDGNK